MRTPRRRSDVTTLAPMSDMGTELTITNIDGGFRLDGEVDAQTAPSLKSCLETYLNDSDGVTLDVREVTFMDSSGLRVLLGVTETCRAQGSDLELVAPTPTVSRLFDISGLAGHFTVTPAG